MEFKDILVQKVLKFMHSFFSQYALYLFFKFMHLFQRQREREVFLPSSGSHIKSLQQPWVNQAKARSPHSIHLQEAEL